MAQAPYFFDSVCIDGYRYRTLAKAWKPQIIRPGSARINLQGSLDTTYGTTAIVRWEGQVVAPVVAPAKGSAQYPWGDIETLRASNVGNKNIAFIDHYGKKYDPATILPGTAEDSLQNVWNGTVNKVYVNLVIMSTDAVAVQLTNLQYP